MGRKKDRIRRGLLECMGIPVFLGGLLLLLLLLGQAFHTLS